MPHLPTARKSTYASHPPSPASSQSKLLADRDKDDQTAPHRDFLYILPSPPTSRLSSLVSRLFSLLSSSIILRFGLPSAPPFQQSHRHTRARVSALRIQLPFGFLDAPFDCPTKPTRTPETSPSSTRTMSESESTATIRTRTTRTSREIITVTVSTVTTPIAKTTTVATTTMTTTPAQPASGDAADMPGPSNGTPRLAITNGTSTSALSGRNSMPTLSTRTPASLLPDKDSISALYARNSMPSLSDRSPPSTNTT